MRDLAKGLFRRCVSGLVARGIHLNHTINDDNSR